MLDIFKKSKGKVESKQVKPVVEVSVVDEMSKILIECGMVKREDNTFSGKVLSGDERLTIAKKLVLKEVKSPIKNTVFSNKDVEVYFSAPNGGCMIKVK